MMLKTSKKGQVGAVVAVGIIVASTIIVYNALTPTLQDTELLQQYNKAKQMMSTIDTAVRELLYEAPGATRTVHVDSAGGTFTVSGSDERITYNFRDIMLLEPGTSTTEGNLIIQSGPTVSSYELDVDNDGQAELVLENAAVLFAISKIGSSDNYSFVNTSSMIKLITNKLINENITPISGIFINDNRASAYGSGYTELIPSGSDQQTRGILVHVEPALGKKYDAVFRLYTGMDYVEMQVTNIY
jgi:hypothetical protein